MISKFDEVKESAIETLKSRLGDPIIGGYILSFMVVNWEIFFYIFSNLEAEEKISTLKELINPKAPIFLEDKVNFIIFFLAHPVILPLFIACFYLFAFPFITRKAHKLILLNRVFSENDRFEAEEKLSPIQSKFSKLEERLSREIDRINDLNNLKSSNEETIRLLKDENHNLREKLFIDAQGSANAVTQESKIVAQIRDKELLADFKGMAKIITTSNLWVGMDEANEFEDAIPVFVSMGLIIRKKLASSEIWVLTDLGIKVLAQI